MPTENRSSTIEQHDHIEGIIDMVSVPRSLAERIKKTCMFTLLEADYEELRMALGKAAPQPHPDPIAWMVGTAFWWTKEEAERDAAATGLPIVGLGPMIGIVPTEQHQGEPVALPERKGTHLRYDTLMPTFSKGWNACLDEIAKLGPLYTRADPGELDWRAVAAERLELVRRWRDRWAGQENKAYDLERKLAERDALLEEAWTHDISTPLKRRIKAALSDSTEPEAT